MQFEFKVLEERFKQLPEDIQMVLTSSGISQQIEDIANKNGLRVDQASVLYDLTSYVLLGLVPSSEFVKTLVKEGKIDTKVATDIAEQINEQVLAGIRTSLRTMQKEHDEIEKSEVPASTKKYTDVEKHTDVEQTQDKHISSLEAVGGFSIVRGGEKYYNEAPHSEPLADHLLNKPDAKPIQRPTVPAAIPTSSIPKPSQPPRVAPRVPPPIIPVLNEQVKPAQPKPINLMQTQPTPSIPAQPIPKPPVQSVPPAIPVQPAPKPMPAPSAPAPKPVTPAPTPPKPRPSGSDSYREPF